jgi:dethiobiotin synthetase
VIIQKRTEKLPGIFITGTDTGIGKTFVSKNILKILVEKGIQPGVMKPVETGCVVKQGEVIPEDALALKKAASIDQARKLINPYALTYPLAPVVSGDLEDIKIERKVILRAFSELRAQYEFMLIEGAGGFFVPLSENYLIAHLARDMALPLIIVARPSLGTINHTLLTIHAARSWNCEIQGVIVNYDDDYKKGLAEKTSPEIIEKFGHVPVIGIVPFIKDDSEQLKRVFEKIVTRIISLR